MIIITVIIIIIIIIMVIITTIRIIPDLNALVGKARNTDYVCSATSKERCRQTFTFTKERRGSWRTNKCRGICERRGE